MKPQTIKVVPNPYSALDADGRAQGVVMKENAMDAYVGAQPDHDESIKTGKSIFTFSTDPVELPKTAYYMRRLQDGALLPADAATAKYAGFDETHFERPDAALAKARDLASAAFEEANGHLPVFALQSQKTA